jgi:hypothetical protein
MPAKSAADRIAPETEDGKELTMAGTRWKMILVAE